MGVLTAVDVDFHVCQLVLIKLLLDFHCQQWSQSLTRSVAVAAAIVFRSSKRLVHLDCWAELEFAWSVRSKGSIGDGCQGASRGRCSGLQARRTMQW